MRLLFSVILSLLAFFETDAKTHSHDPLDGPGPLPPGVDGPLLAITRSRLKKLKQFFAQSPNPRELANNRTDTGSTYLMEAASHGRPDMVRYLLEQGAEPDLCKDDGKTPLILAALLGNVDVIEVLLEEGANWQANPDAVDSQGMSALMYSAATPKVNVVKTLLRHGASTSIRQKTGGMTALMYGTFNGHMQSIRALVEDGHAELEQKDDTGRTALMWAAVGQHTAVKRYLVQRGADRLVVDNMGLSAADYERFAPHVDIKGKWGNTKITLRLSLSMLSPMTFVQVSLTHETSQLIK